MHLLELDELPDDDEVPAREIRVRMAAAQSQSVMVTNLLSTTSRSVLGEWMSIVEASLEGLWQCEFELLDDDRVGCGLPALFDADHSAMLNVTVLWVVRRINVDVGELHMN